VSRRRSGLCHSNGHARLVSAYRMEYKISMTSMAGVVSRIPALLPPESTFYVYSIFGCIMHGGFHGIMRKYPTVQLWVAAMRRDYVNLSICD
jgi:hypothetical protein